MDLNHTDEKNITYPVQAVLLLRDIGQQRTLTILEEALAGASETQTTLRKAVVAIVDAMMTETKPTPLAERARSLRKLFERSPEQLAGVDDIARMGIDGILNLASKTDSRPWG
jgi:hypothetical protein